MTNKTLAENVALVKTNFKAIRDALISNGCDDLTGAPVSEYSNKINEACEISFTNGKNEGLAEAGGTDTSDATATSEDIMEGKTAYTASGETIGTFTITNELSDQEDLISNIKSALVNKATPSVSLQSKTVTPTASQQTVTADSGYDGLNKVVVTGDSNLTADNIKSGTSIFGVTGSYEGSDSGEIDNGLIRFIEGDTTVLNSNSITKMNEYRFSSNTYITAVNLPNCTTIGSSAFINCANLTNVSLPSCTTIQRNAFYYCYNLTSVHLPICTNLGSYAFQQCYKLTSISLPACSIIGNSAFTYCSKLTTVDLTGCTSLGSHAFDNCSSLTSLKLPICSKIGEYAFTSCSKLTSLTLGYSSVVSLANTYVFSYTPMSVSTYTGSFGSIYVPASLVASYKTAKNWSKFSARITAIVN